MDKITALVKNQYTKFPYPSIPIGANEDEVLYSTNYTFIHYFCTGIYKTDENINILDAGCGTGYSTLKLVQQNPNAKITAIDISTNSIKLAKERLKKAGFSEDRVTFKEVNLMELEDLGIKFDYIVSTGVLHHLASPEKGLHNLKKHLKEDGLMYLMLYSEYGRHFINLTRKFISTLEHDSSDFEKGIALGKEFFKVLPQGNMIKEHFAKSNEIANNLFGKEFAESPEQFIDAFLNIQERTYNIEQLFEFIENEGLHFLCFYDQPYWELENLLKESPLLLEKSKNLSLKKKYQLAEVINIGKNFSFFVGNKKFEKAELDNNAIINSKVLLSKLNKHSEENGVITIFSPTGTGVELKEPLNLIFELIKDNKPVIDIISDLKNLMPVVANNAENIIVTLLRNFEKANILFLIQ